MKRSIQPLICLQCKQEEARHEDLLNGLVFCSPECQSSYHRYNTEDVATSEWGKKRRNFYVKHLIEATGIITKYIPISLVVKRDSTAKHHQMTMIVSSGVHQQDRFTNFSLYLLCNSRNPLISANRRNGCSSGGGIYNRPVCMILIPLECITA